MQNLIDFLQSNSALVLANPIAFATISSRTVGNRKCAPSRPVGFDAKHADHRGRGQSVPLPVLRPALC